MSTGMKRVRKILALMWEVTRRQIWEMGWGLRKVERLLSGREGSGGEGKGREGT